MRQFEEEADERDSDENLFANAEKQEQD